MTWWRRRELNYAGVLQTNKLLKTKHAQYSPDAGIALSTHVIHTRDFCFSFASTNGMIFCDRIAASPNIFPSVPIRRLPTKELISRVLVIWERSGRGSHVRHADKPAKCVTVTSRGVGRTTPSRLRLRLPQR